MKPVMPRATGMPTMKQGVKPGVTSKPGATMTAVAPRGRGTPSMMTTAPPRKAVVGPLAKASMLKPLEPVSNNKKTVRPIAKTRAPASRSSYMDMPLLEGTREGMRMVGKTLLNWSSSVVPRVPTVRVPVAARQLGNKGKKRLQYAATIAPSGNSTFFALAAMAAALACLIYVTTSMVSTMASVAVAGAVVVMYARRA